MTTYSIYLAYTYSKLSRTFRYLQKKLPAFGTAAVLRYTGPGFKFKVAI